VVLIVAAFVIARHLAGHLTAAQRTALTVQRMLIAASALQMVIGAIVARGLPGWLG
jgi:hypothetical protein